MRTSLLPASFTGSSAALRDSAVAPGDMNDKEAIRKLMEAVAALDRGDIETSLALQASDAHVLAPLRPAEVGSAAIRASPESVFTLEAVEAHGSWAFTRGSYRPVLIPKNGVPAIAESGKYLEILQQDAAGHGSITRAFGTVIANPRIATSH